MCIFNSFPSNFHSSINRLSNPQIFLFFACLITLFNSSILSCLRCHQSLHLSSPLLFLFHPRCLAHSRVFHSIRCIFFIGSIFSLSLSCSFSCLNILKPRLCVPVMSLSNVLTNLSQSSLLCLRVIFLTIALFFVFCIVLHCFVL